MPKTSIASLPPLDLAFAVGRLIASGKTTAPEVLRLAGERVQRFAALEAELLALTGGVVVTGPAVAPKRATPKRPHFSPQLRPFRRVQGLYAGYLRGFEGAERARLRQINAEKGVEAALAEMRKLLEVPSKGAKAVAGKKSPAAKAATKPAPAKKLRLTAARKAPTEAAVRAVSG